MSVDEWKRASDAFYVEAFQTAWAKLYRHIPDNRLRFAKALVLSSRPVPSHQRGRVLHWYRNRVRLKELGSKQAALRERLDSLADDGIESPALAERLAEVNHRIGEIIGGDGCE